jgi:phosphoenolpyruvate synthase/pyruvate phosphate dikinase
LYTKPLSDVRKADPAVAGGKGASLGELEAAYFPVSPGFVVTTDACRKFRRAPTDAFKREVLAAFDGLGATRVAVRSSATAEDGKDASWAGQFDTFLNVTRDALLQRVQDCWASALSDHVRAYAEGRSKDSRELPVAVVIQKMVNSEVSGVAFSVNPVNRSHDQIMIEAVYGLGEILVQGKVTPDNYVVDKSSLQITSTYVTTKLLMCAYEDGRNAEHEVPAGLRNVSCLSNEQVTQLSQLVINIEQHFSAPQDIEWALERGHFYIIQSRPITTL